MKNLLLLSLLLLSFYGCKDEGNGNGAPGFTHNELAKEFVKNLNLDNEFNVSLVRKDTDQSNYIVVYDPLTQSYDAINIDNYDPANSNANEYYYDNIGKAFFDLDIIPEHSETSVYWTDIGTDEDGFSIWGYEEYTHSVPTKYYDRYSGFIFEKTAATPKDLAKVAALKEVATLEKSAQFLSSEFGLSLNRGKEIARLAAHWKKASMKGMTNAEQDSFSTELLGFSITAGKKAAKKSFAGDSSSLKQLVNDAASKNSISPEHASKLMTRVFGL
ncbi:MAG: hypothetical protein HON90_09380 [Halobacteriovoraceae bacterium]|jgi:hypothetical protein|nr:hypothetical protein [Halobacteriovoraceae bacterium]